MPPSRLHHTLLLAHPRPSLLCLRRISPLRHVSTEPSSAQPTALPWKTPHSITAWPPEPLIPPPKEGELLLERKPNRDLPPLPPFIPTQITRTFPIFVLVMGISIFAFFNYQKQESSVVTSTLYSLRTNPLVRQELGDEIYFASKYPWIKGEINQVHGKIDISFWVKGTKSQGQVRLRCRRRGRSGYFVTQEWSLTMDDGKVFQLYDPEGNAVDPFKDPLGE
ncbi:DUF1783-domain-containing protein [Lindgomyces ingoldianus]|uniref:DUF1783-domain-containing protein n=1 Tax=Lindgomyces ingoldianus TaxID=673940 RepID=A0ACB6QX23_9PLEO|nr:DUF1783-domain-containing protein [Lindgomyces ingoldianus]KAF2471573.1 DUF1783-domain-containing protein [Lindgomyces ingoldianus]